MRLPLEHIPVDLPTSTQIFSLLNCTISEKKNKHVYFNINCCCEEIIPSKKKKGRNYEERNEFTLSCCERELVRLAVKA